MKLTLFGKTIRKLRIEHGLLLGAMAKKIGISSSYLSSIEMGTREIPQGFFEKIKNLKIFNSNELKEIESSINRSIKKFSFVPKNDYQRNLMVSLVRSFDDLTEDQVRIINNILNEKGGKNYI
jgi:transcriptional regulator with XRE-family HTH domain